MKTPTPFAPFAPDPEMVAPALLFTIPLKPRMPLAPEMVPKLLMVSASGKLPKPVIRIPMSVPLTDAPDWMLMILPLSSGTP